MEAKRKKVMCSHVQEEESDEHKKMRLDGVLERYDYVCLQLDHMESQYPLLKKRHVCIVEGNYSTMRARETGVVEAMRAFSGVVDYWQKKLNDEVVPKPPETTVEKYAHEMANKLVALGMSIAKKGSKDGLPTGTTEQLPDKDCPSTQSDPPTSDGDI